MIDVIRSIYVGAYKIKKPSKTNATKDHNKDIKLRALDMVSRGIQINTIAKKLRIDYSTVKLWQDNKERY